MLISQSLSTYALAGLEDAVGAARRWRVVYLLGSAEMRRRYARARLGQFWIMVSSAILVSTMGFVWSFLWKQPVAQILPYIAVGMMVWQLITGVLTDASTAIPQNKHFFLNQYMPTSTIIFALLYRHVATFGFNIVIPMLIAWFLGTPLTLQILLFVPGFILLMLTSYSAAFVIAVLCTRFRDLVSVVASVLQVTFFITPVLWQPELLSEDHRWWLLLNPFAVMIAVVRDPLLSVPIGAATWIAALLFTALSLAAALPFIGMFGRRTIYWL